MSTKTKKNGSIDPYMKVIEECSEVIHILCKIRRFGFDCYHPKDTSKTKNIVLLENELNDLEKAIKLMRQDLHEFSNK